MTDEAQRPQRRFSRRKLLQAGAAREATATAGGLLASPAAAAPEAATRGKRVDGSRLLRAETIVVGSTRLAPTSPAAADLGHSALRELGVDDG
jgi:hypothetical protein